jgi:tRNA A37 threonylcarbamoyltransferase TsaD
MRDNLRRIRVTNPFEPKSNFTFAEMQEAVINIVDSFTDAVDEHVSDDEVKMRIAISFAANVFKRSMQEAARKLKEQQEEAQNIQDFLGGPFNMNDFGTKDFFDGI